MTAAQYAALPRPNWDSLRYYSVQGGFTPKAGTYSGPNGITMLTNPPIGDQGTEGSCVGWGVGYSAMGIINWPKSRCWSIAERSPSYVYNQVKVTADCASGSFILDAVNLVTNQGDCSYNLMPYVNGDCATQPNVIQKTDALQNKAVKFAALNKNDVAGIKMALDLGFPVINGFSVTQSFDNMWANGGVWTTNSGSIRGGHCTCIIGYDDNKQQFKVQNQWGSLQGNNGFYWVSYNLVQNNCINELYILYGNIPNRPFAIIGDANICNTSNSYTLNNLPPGSTVSWSAIPSGIVIINSPNSASTTLTKITNGTVTLTANMSTCGGLSQPSSSIQIKVGYSSSDFPITGGNISGGLLQYCSNQQITFNVTGNVSNVSWPMPQGWQYIYAPTNSTVMLKSPITGGITGNIIANYTDPCGSLGSSSIFAVYNSNACTPSNPYTISPNPASSYITIALASLATYGNIASVQICNSYGQVMSSQSWNNTMQQVQMPVYQLQNGNYIAKINSGTQIYSMQFVLQH